MSESSSSSGGVGFCGLLALLFIGLKLGNVIQWAWLWVLSPLWIPVGILLAVLIAFGLAWVVAKMIELARTAGL